MKNLFKNQKGFSLLELVLVIAILAVVSGILARFLINGMDIYSFVDDRKSLVRESRRAVYFMNRDFRQVISQGVTTATATEILYTNYDNDQISYQYANNEIARNGNTLSEDVSAFQFRYLRADGGYMTLPVTGDSLDFIWNIESEFTVDDGEYSRRF
jgi:prepilin-type N-terminal cleavage/methylation domain-containing protein